MYLVDANVLSEPTKPAPNSRVVDWLSANERNLAVSSIVLGELSIGVIALPPGRRRTQLEGWFAAVAEDIECLPFDAATSHLWATLVVRLRRKGKTMPLLDGLIAATALQHGLTVVTRNTRDFEKAGVEVFDPFASPG